MKNLIITVFLFVFINLGVSSFGASLLIPMDKTQSDHLKAYGLVFKSLEAGDKAEWLLNYRSGSFLLNYSEATASLSLLMGAPLVRCVEPGRC